MTAVSFKDRGSMLLLVGILVLVSSGAFLSYAIDRLYELYEHRQRTIRIQDRIDLLSNRVLQYTIDATLLETLKPRDRTLLSELVVKRREIERLVHNLEEKNEHSVLIQDRVSQLIPKFDQFFLQEDTQTIAREIISSLDELSQEEQEWVESYGKEVTTNIQKLSIASLVFFFFAILLILAAYILRLRTERMKSLMIEDLKNLKVKAEFASQEKSKFLSTVSHEIRTPLNGIIGLSDLLIHSKMSSQDLLLAKTINQSGKTLLRILNDILDFSKFNNGRVKLIENDFCLEDTLRFVYLNLIAKAEEKNLILRFEINQKVPKTLRADPERLTQVLFNLIGNAIKFSAKGSVVLKVQYLSQGPEGVKIRFLVSDEGIGIDLKDQEKLFEPFVQIKQTGTNGEVGTGLGLSICRGIISSMGSEIIVQSSPGFGSTFYFDLNFSRFSEEIFSSQLVISDRGDQSSTNILENFQYRPTILIVDDNLTNQLVADSVIKRLGFETVLASNGAEAFDVFMKMDIDLILMDCQMPVMNGMAATKKIRDLGFGTPIVALTANAEVSDRNLCLQAGMDDFMTKPIATSVLIEKILKFIPQQRVLSSRRLIELSESLGDSKRNQVLEAFLTSVSQFKQDFVTVIASQDLSQVQRLGHKNKGAATTIGAVAFKELCERLEAIKSIEEAESLFDELYLSLKNLTSEIEQFIMRQDDSHEQLNFELF